MLLLLYGKDTYRSIEKFKKIKKEFQYKKNKNDLIFFDFSGKEKNIQDLKQEIFQDSIFKNNKVFFLKKALTEMINDSEIVKFFKNLQENNEKEFIFWEEEIDKKNILFKIIKEKGKIELFDLLDSLNLKKWIKEKIEERGGKINNLAIDKLFFYSGNDSWLLSNEINKLVDYKKQEIITVDDVDFLVSSKIEGDIFKAIDFLGNKNISAAIEVFYRHIKKGDHILYLITMIAYQFRNLILIKMSKNVNAKDLGMHPFVFYKSLKQSSLFSEKELKTIYSEILKAEKDIKTGKATPEAALDFLITAMKN